MIMAVYRGFAVAKLCRVRKSIKYHIVSLGFNTQNRALYIFDIK